MRRLDSVLASNHVGGDENGPLPVRQYITDMRIAGYSPVTIKDRTDLLERFRSSLDGRSLLDATADDLRAFQASVAHLSPASCNIYARHLKAFYDWARKRRLTAENIAEEMVIPRVPRTQPHPTRPDDLRLIFKCTQGMLRISYALAAFAGLRRGEICRLQRPDLFLDDDATALVHGKGRKERVVPLIAPVVDELRAYGLPRTGAVVRHPSGEPVKPGTLSAYSHNHLVELGTETTLHSMRAAFATDVARTTKDPLFVRDLLGHSSVSTTERYMLSSMNNAHARLSGLAAGALDALGKGRRLRAVGDD